MVMHLRQALPARRISPHRWLLLVVDAGDYAGDGDSVVPAVSLAAHALHGTDLRQQAPENTGAYLSVVGKSYEVVQFAEVARTLVGAGDVKAVLTTAGTLGPVGIRG